MTDVFVACFAVFFGLALILTATSAAWARFRVFLMKAKKREIDSEGEELYNEEDV